MVAVQQQPDRNLLPLRRATGEWGTPSESAFAKLHLSPVSGKDRTISVIMTGETRTFVITPIYDAIR